MQTSSTIRFRGGFTHSLDAKNRLSVPKKWRFEGDQDDGAYLAISHPMGYILMLPPARALKLEDRIDEIPVSDMEAQNMAMSLMEESHNLSCDKGGRVVIPSVLKEYTGISKDAQIIGMGSYFVIWDPERRSLFRDDPQSVPMTTRGRKLLETMKELGL